MIVVPRYFNSITTWKLWPFMVTDYLICYRFCVKTNIPYRSTPGITLYTLLVAKKYQNHFQSTLFLSDSIEPTLVMFVLLIDSNLSFVLSTVKNVCLDRKLSIIIHNWKSIVLPLLIIGQWRQMVSVETTFKRNPIVLKCSLLQLKFVDLFK